MRKYPTSLVKTYDFLTVAQKLQVERTIIVLHSYSTSRSLSSVAEGVVNDHFIRPVSPLPNAPKAGLYRIARRTSTPSASLNRKHMSTVECFIPCTFFVLISTDSYSATAKSLFSTPCVDMIT